MPEMQSFVFGHLLLSLAEAALISWALLLWKISRSLAMIVLLILLISLGYDNFILAIGNRLGEGSLLLFLSKIRFLAHILVIPFFFVIGIELANRAGAGWVIPLTRGLAWGVAFGLGILEYFNEFLNLSLVPIEFAGLLRYTADSSSVPIVTIVSNLFLLGISIGFWIRLEGKWPWLFFGTLVALIVNTIPIDKIGTLPGSSSEFILVLSLLLTERYLQYEAPDLGLDEGEKFRFRPLQFNWVAIHPRPKGVIYFIGGAGFGSFPTLFYRYILRRLFQEGYTIVALPFRFTFNHWSVAVQMVQDQEQFLAAIHQEATSLNYSENLDIYISTEPDQLRSGNYFWLGHSLGCKYIALLEILSDSEKTRIDRAISACIKDKRQVEKLGRDLEKVDLEKLSLCNQPSILMAPIITGVEGAIPIRALAHLVKKFVDVNPNETDTKCMIRSSKLFHYTGMVGFREDKEQAKAETINFLLEALPKEPFPPIYEQLNGGHLAPLNLLERNNELAEQLIQLLFQLHRRVGAK
ncbi:MAG: DUF1350 domain-containing protein [Leptolyngbya sp. SIOISBB]|nr:DUF1350 domain-containing protein [Leptolyngbya sp. SIOISBB]